MFLNNNLHRRVMDYDLIKVGISMNILSREKHYTLTIMQRKKQF